MARLTPTPPTDGVSNRRELLRAFGYVVGVNALGAAPAVRFGADTAWIERPAFYPPEIAFPIAWTLLFTLMGIALYLVRRRGRTSRDDRRQRAVRLATGAFAVQFALNIVWTPAFFGLQRPDLGLAVIALLWIAIIGTIYAFDRVDRRAALLLVPYLAWVTFAAVLNYAIYASWAG